MGIRKLGFLCVCVLLAGIVPTTGVATQSTSAQKPLNILLKEQKQVQEQLRDIRQKIRFSAKRVKEVENRISFNQQQTNAIQTQRTNFHKEIAAQYGAVMIPLFDAFQAYPSDSALRQAEAEQQQLSESRSRIQAEQAQLQRQQAELHNQLRSVSEQIAKTVHEAPNEASLEGLDLEKLAVLFAWPVPTTKEVSSDYGWRMLNGSVEFHSGIDVAADLGEPIRASADGVVLYAGPAQGFGHWIVLLHEQGLLTVYGHMYRSGVKVKPGQKVHKGQVIGQVGADGQSYGPHLHFAIARGLSGGLPNTINPWDFLDP